MKKPATEEDEEPQSRSLLCSCRGKRKKKKKKNQQNSQNGKQQDELLQVCVVQGKFWERCIYK